MSGSCENAGVRSLVVLAVVVAATSCGGGRVDPGFYGEGTSEETRAAARAPARGGDVSPPARFDKPKLVLIRADWCGICHEVEPGILTAFATYEGKVDLVVLDVSDPRRTAHSADVARAEGVSEFFDRYMGRTPTLGVFTRPEEARLIHGPIGEPAHLRRELEAAVDRMHEPH
jgi:hypothetical protein